MEATPAAGSMGLAHSMLAATATSALCSVVVSAVFKCHRMLDLRSLKSLPALVLLKTEKGLLRTF